MQLSNEEEDYNLSLSKFESMLKTNKVLFFDSEEFEEIILHYLDMGKAALAKKALKLALEQQFISENGKYNCISKIVRKTTQLNKNKK